MPLSKQWERPTPGQRRETAAYVATMVADLRQLARKNDLPTLAYLLDMARLEAESEARSEAHMDVGGDDEGSSPVLDGP